MKNVFNYFLTLLELANMCTIPWQKKLLLNKIYWFLINLWVHEKDCERVSLMKKKRKNFLLLKT